MRILFVNKFAEVTGGADRYALELARLLSANGHEVRFVAFKPQGELPAPGWYLAPTVTGDSRAALGKAGAARVFGTLLWNRQAGAALQAAIDSFSPDLVHIHKIFPQLSIAPAAVAARNGIPIVQRAADYEFLAAHPEDFSGSRIDRISSTVEARVANTVGFELRRRFHIPRISTWMVATKFMKDVYARSGIDAEAIPHFIEDAEGDPERRHGDRDGIAMVGRLVPKKGVRDTLELARRAPDLQVTIAGTGELIPEVEKAAAELPNLTLVGRLDPLGVNALLDRSRLVVVPSLWPEPAGLSALEAMSRGTPVVAYACGGLTDYVESNGGGVVVEQGDVDALVKAVLDLDGDEARWSMLSKAGRHGVVVNHEPGRHLRRVEALYRRALVTDRQS